ncbi:substrate-binding domain-containing protein, partial [bacterium]|nr:substrate-binding domain-containing protein [bacterium]
AVGGCGWRSPHTVVRAYVARQGASAFHEIAEAFEQETGIRVVLREARRCDLYEVVRRRADGDLVITGDRTTLGRLREADMDAAPAVSVGILVPVIVVAKGNPQRIWTLADLVRPTVTVAVVREPACMVQATRAILDKNHLTRMVARNIVSRPRSSAQAIRAVGRRTVDATIVWRGELRERRDDRVQAVAIPPGQNVVEPIEAMVLDTGENGMASVQFVTYLRSPAAQAVMARAGLLVRP